MSGIAQHAELRRKILFTLFILAVYRMGVHVPTPGVDGNAVMEFFQAQSGGIFGLFNTFTGGALQQFSVFALGIMPYISSSIIFQLLTSAVPYLEALKKEGEAGRRKINQYTRYGTVILAVVQGYGISSWLMNSQAPDGASLVLAPSVGFIPFQVMTVLTLTAGTCFIMWLGEQITDRGIGNGASLIIFAGIAAGIPSGASSLVSLISSGEMSAGLGLIILSFMVLVVGFVIFVEAGQRRLPIHQSASGSSASYLPLKLNFSGVIPPIFASSLLLFPATMTQFVDSSLLVSLQESLAPGGVIYNVLFVGLVIFFCFFYTEIVFNPTEVADNLKKGGRFIPGIRAGKSTSDYITKVVERVNVVGALYLSLVCVLPGILIETTKVPFYFGGTSLLILVAVAIDTVQKIQEQMISPRRYEAMMKSPKMRGRRVKY